MNENLLQFIWQFKLLDFSNPLRTTEGQELTIINSGMLNRDAGPDFLEARIKIDETIWIGNIELHIKSSDWNKHLHSQNENYNNLILHAVWENDAAIETQNKSNFPIIELKNYINSTLLQQYERMMNLQGFVPCENHIAQVSQMSVNAQLNRMLIERIESKVEHVAHLLKQTENDWLEVFYIYLSRAFGIHINQDAFEQLALQTPLKIFAKHKSNLLQIEALLYGQAGFLFDYFDENYPLQLKKEYEFLQIKHNLIPLEKKRWKFLRLRPANFPTIRLAQFAQIIFNSNHLFSKILETSKVKDLEKLLQCTVSDYWLNHYTFSEASTERTKTLGKNFIHSIIINSIVPIIFLYGKMNGKDKYCEQAIDLLNEIPAEKNAQIEQWRNLGMEVKTAEDSQAFLQLKKNYCDKKRCLDCGIGLSILKQ